MVGGGGMVRLSLVPSSLNPSPVSRLSISCVEAPERFSCRCWTNSRRMSSSCEGGGKRDAPVSRQNALPPACCAHRPQLLRGGARHRGEGVVGVLSGPAA